MRDKKRPEVQVTATDAKELFAAVDDTLRFVSEDTGFARRGPVKRRLLGRDQFEQETTRGISDKDSDALLARTELILKKFGLFSPDFKLKEFLLKNSGKQLGGFYNSKDKTMYLLDWIPLEAQRPIMAHELTHALQDQNYDLTRFATPTHGAGAPSMSITATDDMERSTVRRAMVEGQARIVEWNYLLQAREVNLANVPPAVLDRLVNLLQIRDAPVALHNSPRVIKELMEFPYIEGLAFELEILRKGGRDKAFAGMFAHPPRSTHEVMDPADYLRRAQSPTISIPDLRSVLGTSFEPYDAGSVGQLDTRIMARDFGQENDIYAVAQYWAGGAYVAVRRSAQGKPAMSTSDVALLYVSRWKTPEAAKRFVEIYQRSLPKRVTVQNVEPLAGKCPPGSRCKEPLWATRVTTSEGPVFLEIWPGNILLITHSFEADTVSRLRQIVLPAVLSANNDSAPKRELSELLYQYEAFAALQDQIGSEISEAVVNALNP
jgi:hypothetical protein